MRRCATTAVTAGMAGLGLLGAFLGSAATAAGAPGSLDPTYGSGGKAVISGTEGIPDSAQLEANGDLLVAVGGSLVRVLNNGSIDTSFANKGISKTSEPFTSGKAVIEGASRAFAVESGGKIVEAGTARQANGEFAIGVTRLTSTGALDPSFGTGGKVITSFNQKEFELLPEGVIVEPSGKILVLCNATQPAYKKPKTFGVVFRYNSNGTLDTSFGSGGIATFSPSAVVTIGLDAAGDSFVLRSVGAGEGSEETELSPTGQVDSSVTPEPITASSVPIYGSVPRLFEPNGESIAATTLSVNRKSYEIEVEKLLGSGALDPAFTLTPFRYTLETTTVGKDYAAGAALAPNGKIVVVGPHVNGSTGTSGVARLNENGTLDTSFGTGGALTEPFSGGYAVAVEPDGDIIDIGVGVGSETNPGLGLVRYVG